METTVDKDKERLERLRGLLEEEGYKDLRIIEGKGICGIRAFIYTAGLCYGLDETGYKGRYCYPYEKVHQLAFAYKTWTGKGDPSGDWVKHKGQTEYTNLKFDK